MLAPSPSPSSSDGSIGRWLLVVVASIAGLQSGQGERPLVMAVLLALVLVAAVAAIVGPLRTRASTHLVQDTRIWMSFALVVALVISGARLAHPLAPVPVAVSAVAAAYVLVGVWALSGAWTGGSVRRAIPFLVVHVAASALALARTHPVIDVRAYLEHATGALLGLANPYGGSVPNPYSPEETARFLSPAAVQGDRILLGYPYLPGSLLPDLAGRLLGDVRVVHLVCLVLVAVWAWRAACDATGRVAALVLLASPLSMPVLLNYWVEPIVLAALCLVVRAMLSGRPVGIAVALGLLLTTKQYLVGILPLLWLARRAHGWRTVAGAVALAAAVVGGFWLWEPSAFWHDVVTFQFDQPYRDDSTSLVVALGREFGRPPAWVSGLAPLFAGVIVSTLVSVRAPATATMLAAGTGLALLATVLLSKQAFPNYFLLVQGALLLAVVTWPRDERHDALLTQIQ